MTRAWRAAAAITTGTILAIAATLLCGVREQRGMSLAQTGEASQGRFSAGTVGSWERAERHVSAEELARYAAWLGVPVRLLLPPEDGERDLLLEATASLAARIAVLDVTRRVLARVGGDVGTSPGRDGACVMSENDAIVTLILTAGAVKIVAVCLRYRAGQRAADRKQAKETPR